jgi:signal transduction histidine kinase
MTRQQQERAFRRFATSNGGAGLGLAIVDRLAVAGGGTATLSDTPGGGLTVTIELPQARNERRRGGGHPHGGHAQGEQLSSR